MEKTDCLADNMWIGGARNPSGRNAMKSATSVVFWDHVNPRAITCIHETISRSSALAEKKMLMAMLSQKMYMEQEFGAAAAAEKAKPTTVKRTGKTETIAGYKCEHIMVTDMGGMMRKRPWARSIHRQEGSPMIRSIIRATVVLACVSTVAHAQFGGLIKKAREKVEAKAENKAENAIPVKPLEGDPLTESTLVAVLKGLSLEAESKDKTKQLWTAIEAKAKEVNEAERAAGDEPDKWHKASRDIESCASRSISESEKIHEKEMPQKVMALNNGKDNTAVIAKLNAVGKRMADAQAKGDTPAFQKAFADYGKMLGFDPAKDSAVAYAKCGKLPAKPASMVKLDQLKAEVDQLTEQRRAEEAEIGGRAAKASGIPADKYALARERLLTWNSEGKGKSGRRSLTKEENDLFLAHASDIRKVESVLQ